MAETGEIGEYRGRAEDRLPHVGLERLEIVRFDVSDVVEGLATCPRSVLQHAQPSARPSASRDDQQQREQRG